MPGRSRSLPNRPSLRYLRLEAKRRLAAGEFPALHDAQVAIAWEHGLPNWAALKQRICVQDEQQSHALAQLRWLISRFSVADQPGWIFPGEDEMREHFDDRFLAVIPVAKLTQGIAQIAAELRGELVVIAQRPLEAHVQLAGMRYLTSASPDPPHRLLGLQGFPVGERITDPRLTAAPAAQTLGAVPAGITGIAADACAELGLAALVLAGGEPGGLPWVVATGWADLDRAEVLTPGHRFPAAGVTALVTTTAVLRLVAEGRVGLDAPANDYLRAARLADEAITVRDLLTHTSGIGNPADLYGESVLDLAALMGPVVPSSGRRGELMPANGAFAVLGQLIADVTQAPFAAAATRLVLDPLGLRDSGFPTRLADVGAGAVTGYTVTPQGIFVSSPDLICTIQAVGGLWSTGADLVRLATGWSSLLPAPLAREALVPHGRQGAESSHGVGLGWLIGAHGDIAAHQGMGLEGTASLHIRIRDNRAHVVLTNRQIAATSLDDRLWRAWTNPSRENRE